MTASKLFEFVILHHPAGIGRSRSLLMPTVQTVVAISEVEARIHAARAIPDNFTANLGEVEILIRPFV